MAKIVPLLYYICAGYGEKLNKSHFHLLSFESLNCVGIKVKYFGVNVK
jgi:hypothetical protein